MAQVRAQQDRRVSEVLTIGNPIFFVLWMRVVMTLDVTPVQSWNPACGVSPGMAFFCLFSPCLAICGFEKLSEDLLGSTRRKWWHDTDFKFLFEALVSGAEPGLSFTRGKPEMGSANQCV